MDQSRTQKGMKNVLVALSLNIFFLIFQFVNRSIFVKILTAEYLGLNGLFSNILTFLSLSELGVGVAMSFALYKPLAENDIELIKSIMRLYKRLYQIIGIIVFVIGVSLTPFLQYLIKEMPENMPYLRVYYILYVVNSAVSYFYTYKRSLIICDQKQYISSITTTASKILLSILQIIILLVTNNYMFYLVIMVVMTVAENLLISQIADRQYPYLKDKNIENLNEDVKNSIRKNIMAMFCHKIGGVVVSSTSNIIISKVVGLVAVGLYSNYTLITNALNEVASQFFTALTSSVGNLSALESREHTKEVYERILFLNFWMFGFMSVCLFNLFNPFIRLWVGEKFVFDNITVAVIVINFYIQGMRKTVLMFRDATGVFWQDRYKPLIESIVNLATSIPLAVYFGVKGVLMGTIISTLFVSFWLEAYMLYKYSLHCTVKNYFCIQFKYLCTFLCSLIFTFLCTSQVSSNGIFGFICKIAICATVPNLIFLLIFRKNEQFLFYLNFLKINIGSLVCAYLKRK